MLTGGSRLIYKPADGVSDMKKARHNSATSSNKSINYKMFVHSVTHSIDFKIIISAL